MIHIKDTLQLLSFTVEYPEKTTKIVQLLYSMCETFDEYTALDHNTAEKQRGVFAGHLLKCLNEVRDLGVTPIWYE